MPEWICPECGAENPQSAERCLNCHVIREEDLEGDLPEAIEPTPPDQVNIIPQEGQDLPELLHSLKEDGEKAVEASQDEEQSLESSSEQPDPFEKPESDDEIPDWLERIRKRAQEEGDSIGEITQKIMAAQESLVEDQDAEQRRRFETWVQSIKSQLEDQSGGEDDDEDDLESITDDTHPVEPDWLKRLRKAREGDEQEGSEQPDIQGDSLLQWLVALEDGDETALLALEQIQNLEGGVGEETQRTSFTGDESVSEETQEVRIDEPVLPAYKPASIIVSPQEDFHAQQLAATIRDEYTPIPGSDHTRARSSWLVRLVIAGIMLTALSLALFGGFNPSAPQNSPQPHHEGVITWLETLPDEPAVLLVFDYQAGFSGEMMRLSRPFMVSLQEMNSHLTVISTTASGVLLNQQLLVDDVLVEDISITDLGYLPLASFGAFSLGLQNQVAVNPAFLPEPVMPLSSLSFDGIVILSGDYEGSRGWIEQLTALTPETPLLLLVTAQAGPIVMPYWESGQVIGLVAGKSEALVLESDQVEDRWLGNRWGAYRVGVLITIGFIVLGVIINDNRDANDDSHWGEL